VLLKKPLRKRLLYGRCTILGLDMKDETIILADGRI